MQKHKKWLIITIWISTIAFVGAGFVGWGSYNYGKSDGAIAVVGDKEVPLADLQNEYSNLYSQYQNMFGGKFTQEMAEQFKLEQAALQRVVQKYLFLNYADDLGLMTTDEEVAQELVQIEAFQKDGKFDKDTYLQVLKQNRRTASEFEKQLKQDLLISKIQKIFSFETLDEEIENIGSLIFAQSKVAIKVLEADTIDIKPTQEQLQEYYENNKENYKSPTGYEIAVVEVENLPNTDQKQMLKVALKQYLDLKKGEEKFSDTQVVYNLNSILTTEALESFTKTSNGEILKPFYKDDKHFIVKKIKTIQPQTLAFEDIQTQITQEYILTQKQEVLTQQAEEYIPNFEGEDIGWLTRESLPTLSQLSQEESQQLVEAIFNSLEQTNFVNFKDKVVVFHIEDTKLGTMDQRKNEMVVSTISNYKSNAISSELLEQLQNKYDVKTYLTE